MIIIIQKQLKNNKMMMKGSKWYIIGLLLLALLFTSQCRSLDKPQSQFLQPSKQEVTIVTGLWYIKGRNRNFQKQYLDFIKKILDSDDNMIIFGEQIVKNFTMKYRKRSNTRFILKNFTAVENFWFVKKMVSSLNQKNSTWFKDHVYHWNIVFKQQQYLPVQYAKLYLLKQAIKLDPFHTDNFMWLDASIYRSNRPWNATVKNKKRHAFTQFPKLLRLPLWFRGIRYSDLDDVSENKYSPFLQALRFQGGQFGGKKHQFLTALNTFENIFKTMIYNNDIFTEEAVFRIFTFRCKYLANFAWDRPQPSAIIDFDFQGRIPLPPVFIRRHNYRVSYPQKNEELSADFQIFEEEKYDNFPQILTKAERISFIAEKFAYTGCSVALVLLIFLILRRFEKIVE